MRFVTKLFCILLVLALCLSALSGTGEPPGEDAPVSGPAPSVTADGTDGADPPLTLSILGDSISTMAGWTSGAAADTTNSTIRRYDPYYSEGTFGLRAADTWWAQAADALGMEILVNNSWSGTCIFSSYDPDSAGCSDRCVNLHDDTGGNAGQEPDIIAVYLGSNDLFTYGTGCGSPEEVDYDALITREADGSFTYLTPRNTAEACAILFHRITQRYPEAQIYCFTIPRLADVTLDPEPVNRILRANAQRYGAVVVDLYADSGITAETAGLRLYYGDFHVHPGAAGMDVIANCFVAALLQNCPWLSREWVRASYSLSGVLLEQGTPPALPAGEAYDTGLVSVNGGDLEITVTMGGEDVTDRCCRDGRIHIDSVSGDLLIQAVAL